MCLTQHANSTHLPAVGPLILVWLAGLLLIVTPGSLTLFRALHLCAGHSHVLSYTNFLFFKILINYSFIYSSSSWLKSNHWKAALLYQHPGMVMVLGIDIHSRAFPSLLISGLVHRIRAWGGGLSFSLHPLQSGTLTCLSRNILFVFLFLHKYKIKYAILDFASLTQF